jgi:hypothetical protein
MTLWPDEYRGWAASRGLLHEDAVLSARLASSHVPAVAAVTRRSPSRALVITSPPTGATYMIDPTLRPEFQTVPLRAAASGGGVEWTVDGRPVVSGSGEASWPLRRGLHVVRARDASGRAAESRITVK